MPRQTTLMSLNEDIYNEIFQYLKAGDLVALALTSQGLQNIVAITSRKVVLDARSLYRYDTETIVKYMNVIKYNVRELIMDQSSYYNAARDLEFPLVKRLVIDFLYSMHKLKPLSKMFPRLKILSLSGSTVNFESLCTIRKLRHLRIKYWGNAIFCKKLFQKSRLKSLKLCRYSGNCCFEIEENLDAVCECKSLQLLHTTAHQIRTLIPRLGELPRLRMLAWDDVFHNHDHILYDIDKKYSDNIKGVYTSSERSINFFNIRNCTFNLHFITKGIGIQFKNVRRIYWLESDRPGKLPILTEANKEALLFLLSKCKRLHSFEIAGVKLERKFLESLTKELNSINDKCDVPLEVRFYNTNIIFESLRKAGLGTMENVFIQSGTIHKFETFPTVYLEWNGSS